MLKVSCRFRLPALAVVLSVFPLLLAGCAGLAGATSSFPKPNIEATGANVTGNWSFAVGAANGSTAPAALNAGLTTANSQVSGVAHLTGSTCVDPATNIVLSGAVNANNQVTLTSQSFNGTKLTLTGQISADGKSMTGVNYAFTGGSCGTEIEDGGTIGTQYSSINGTYSGNFVDGQGDQIPVTATLTQTSQPDSNGEFQLSGSATFPSSPCFPSQPIVTDSTVTGSSLSTTYGATVNGQMVTVTATGTFNSGATQLTIANWTVAGGECDGMTGTGLLTQQ